MSKMQIKVRESKKNEDGGKETSALLHLNTKGSGSELDAHEFLDDLYLKNRNRLGGFVRIYSKDLGEVTGVYAASRNPEVLAEYLKLYMKEYVVRQDMHDGNWTEPEDVKPYVMDCLTSLVRKVVPAGVHSEDSNPLVVAYPGVVKMGDDGTFYVKDRVSSHIDEYDNVEDAAQCLIDIWKKYNLNQGESKKRSEKRTVQPPSYDVYTYDELSDEAKEKVKSWFLDIRREDDGDVFQDSCMDTLYDLFPNSDVKIEYSLSYSQGDGFNTYGTLSVDDLLNVDLSRITFTDSNITPLSDKDAIKAVCEKADVTSIALPENRRYGYSMADRIEVVPDYDVELTDEETALLSELEKFAQDVMGFLNKQNEDWGYEYFYEATDEEVADWANANDYEFTEDGELA